MSDNETAAAMLRAAIAAGPADHTAALAWADALEAAEGAVRCPCTHPDGSLPGSSRLIRCPLCANGGWVPHPRAEFVRVQCALAQVPTECYCSGPDPTGCVNCRAKARLLRRELDLLARHRDAWLRVPCAVCGGVGYHTVDVHDTERAPCLSCNGTGNTPTRLTKKTDGWTSGLGNVSRDRYPVAFRRGLPDRIEGAPLTGAGGLFESYHEYPPGHQYKTDADWYVAWRPSPLLLSWVRHHPSVTEVVPNDREPAPFGAPATVHGYGPESEIGTQVHRIPAFLFNALTGYDDSGGWRWFSTRASAVSALGRAVAVVAKRYLKGSR